VERSVGREIRKGGVEVVGKRWRHVPVVRIYLVEGLIVFTGQCRFYLVQFESGEVRADDGWRTNFWEDKWRGNSKLCEQFPSLFAISIYKEVSVREMWELTNSFEEFDLPWRRTLFVWERRLLNDMFEVLEGFYCSQGTDSWKWRPEENGLFSVNSAYILLEKLMVWEERWGEVEKKVFRYLWKGQLLLLEWFLSL